MKSWGPRTIGAKMAMVYALAFTLGALGFGVGLYAIGAISNANRVLIEEDFARLDLVLELRTAVFAQLSEARNYALTPSDATLRRYHTAHSDTHKFLSRAKANANGQIRNQFDRVEGAKRVFDDSLERGMALARQGDTQGAARELRAGTVAGFDKRVFDLEQVVEHEAEDAAGRARDLGGRAMRLSIFLGIAMFAVALGGGLILRRLFLNISTELDSSSAQLTTSTSEIASAAEEVSRGVESQLNQVVDTSSAMEEMTTSIKEVSRSAKGASDEVMAVSNQVGENAEKIRQAVDGVKRANESLVRLKTRSDQIGEVIRLIGEIAAQTNILALNAAIEAARAGEYGKGFDVVAEEIRKLALRTSQSTSEIAPVIESLQHETQETAELVAQEAELASDVGSSFNGIAQAINSATRRAQAISSAAIEQAKTAEQIADSLQVISGAGREAAQSAEDTAAATHELAGLAGRLRKITGQLKAS